MDSAYNDPEKYLRVNDHEDSEPCCLTSKPWN